MNNIKMLYYNRIKVSQEMGWRKLIKEILTFGDIDIKKNIFYRHEIPILLKDGDIEKVLVSNKISSAQKNFKYFIGYLYNDNKVKPLYMFLKTSAHVKRYDGQTKLMYTSLKMNKLEKYNTMYDKFSSYIKKLITSLSITKTFWKPN